ncbi:unnamed protein product [Calypogeia fissa]
MKKASVPALANSESTRDGGFLWWHLPVILGLSWYPKPSEDKRAGTPYKYVAWKSEVHLQVELIKCPRKFCGS